MDKLYGEHEYAYEDTEKTKGMAWVQNYLRMKQVIVFKLSHDVLQASLSLRFYVYVILILTLLVQLLRPLQTHLIFPRSRSYAHR